MAETADFPAAHCTSDRGPIGRIFVDSPNSCLPQHSPFNVSAPDKACAFERLREFLQVPKSCGRVDGDRIVEVVEYQASIPLPPPLLRGSK